MHGKDIRQWSGEYPEFEHAEECGEQFLCGLLAGKKGGNLIIFIKHIQIPVNSLTIALMHVMGIVYLLTHM